MIEGAGPGPVLNLVENRLLQLEQLGAEDGIALDQNAFGHMRAFLAQLGVAMRPGVFLRDDGSPRIMWSTPVGDPQRLQFAASFLTDGKVQVVRSHGPVVPLRTSGRLVAGGLVAETMLGRRLLDVLHTSGLEDWVRGGPRPLW